MKTVHFLNNSEQIENIIKGFSLTRSLFVSSLLTGEPHTGKKSLIKQLFPSAFWVDASEKEVLEIALKEHSEIVIYNFHTILNCDHLKFENKKIIAISDKVNNRARAEKKFAFIYTMPNLEKRDDLPSLISSIQKIVEEELMVSEPVELDSSQLDLSQNFRSLKASISRQVVVKNCSKEDIQNILFDYFMKHLEGNNVYREHLPLFESALIEAGLQKHKSQLKLSKVLGLNRNTLRKKIEENNID